MAAMKRRMPSFAAVLALFAFVFAQMLAAVYACEMGTPAQAAAVADTQAAALDCCDPALPSMDPACDNHCQQAGKTSERVHVPPAPVPLTAIVVMPTKIAGSHHVPRSTPARAPDLARHIAPPLSIRNCCFRI